MIKTNYSAGTVTFDGVELTMSDMATIQDALQDAIIGGRNALVVAEIGAKLGITIDADLMEEDESPNASTTGQALEETEDTLGLPEKPEASDNYLAP